MKRIIHIMMVIVLTLVMMVEYPTHVYASTWTELQERLEDLLEEQEANQEAMDQTQYEINLTTQLLAEIYGRIGEIEESILVIDGDINALNDRILAKEEEIYLTQLALEDARLEEADYRQQISERIQVMYEYGEAGYMEVLLESDNLNDFFTRLEYMTQIFNYDEKMLENLEGMQDEIYAQETQLEIERLNLDIIMGELEVKEAQAQQLYDDKAAEFELIESNQLLLDQQMALLEEIEDQLFVAIASTEEEIELLSAWSDGVLGWPSPGQTRITSQFGPRLHPIHGTYKMHNGIDIGMPYGTDIVAAGPGIVVRADYSASYGNVIMIKHGIYQGSMYYTIYAHNSSLLVSEGDEVEAGQHIAEAGSTGWSTGVHLHFGVMKDDAWVDPMEYFGN